MKTVLIFAEEARISDPLKAALANHLPLIVTENKAQCLHVLKQKSVIHKAFISVIKAPKNLTIFKEISEIRPELELIAVGDQSSEETAVEAVRLGAAGHIILPLKSEEILAMVR